MKRNAKTGCPLNKFKPCKQRECAWFVQLRGMDPNTGQEIDEWGCAIAWQTILMIENSQQQRHTAAAVESFRNEMVASNNATLALFADAASGQKRIRR